MALSTRLMMRQGQSLVMTPQLLQAIKLLQFSHLELNAFVQDELDRNPLLERVDEGAGAADAQPAIDRYGEAERGEAPDAPDWSSPDLAVDAGQLSADLGTDVSNAFDADAPPTPAAATTPDDPGLRPAPGPVRPDPDRAATARQPISKPISPRSRRLPNTFPDSSLSHAPTRPIGWSARP